MCDWFCFTACSASETKLAAMAGTRTALQYCRILACSKASVWFFIESPPEPEADRSCPSPVADVRTAPVLATAQWRGACARPRPAYCECATPPPHRSHPDARLLPPLESIGPSHRLPH